MAVMRGGAAGHQRMKVVTTTLLERIRDAVPHMQERELESQLPMGLRSYALDRLNGEQHSAGDKNTGQAFRRYLTQKTALTWSKMSLVVAASESALGLAFSDDDLLRLGIHGLPSGADPTPRFENYENAQKQFNLGLERMRSGVLPCGLSERGGRPRAPRNKAEAQHVFAEWKHRIAQCGGRVYEDRPCGPPDLLEPEDEYERREWDYQSLDEWQRPLDPFNPHPVALDRMRLMLVGNWGASRPVYPQPLTPQRASLLYVTASATASDSDDDLESELRRLLSGG
ncbi:hypothetical protein R69608_05090 [Paraburkholderia nemoris]|nr:hypothetical protein R69608_05090 [Paraburkholderia nemoris]